MRAPTMGLTEWVLVSVLALLWGSVFFLVEVALTGFGPFSLVLGRVGIGAIVLVAFVFATGRRLPGDGRAWGAFVVMGALNNMIPFSLIAWGQVAIGSGLAAILNATAPLFAVVLAHYLTTDEPMTANRAAGVGLGFAGVVVLIGLEAIRGLGLQGLGQLAILGAALSYAFAGIYGRRLRRFPPLVAAAGMLVAATALALPAAVALERPWLAEPNAAAWGAVGALAVFGTAAAYLIYFRILAAAGATNVLLVTLLMPPVALGLGIGLLGEAPGPGAYAGMALILVGLATVDGRLFLWLKPPAQQ